LFLPLAQNSHDFERITMQALIPLSLTECLAPREVGALLSMSEAENRPVEDLVVFAIRDLLEARKKLQVEGRGGDAANPQ
jgi:hypothetical protein